MDPTPSVDQELEAIRRGNQRRRLILAGVIVVLGAGTLVQDFAAALAWAPPAIGRSLLGALGSAAGVLLWRQPRTGWPLALAWAAIQVPFYAWTPDGGSPTAQWLQFPLTMTESLRQNGQLVRYSSMGVNLVGVVLVVWLRWWRDLLVPGST